MTEPRSVSDLCVLELQGCCPDLLLFWGHQSARNGGLGPGCLSQWWPASFTVDGVNFLTAEHFMMVGKARLFGDEVTAARILDDPSPGEAKKLGRLVKHYDDDVWTTRRYGIVLQGSLAKFGQNPALRKYLLSTAGAVLVEASPTDRVWGIGLAADDENAYRPSRWKGLNLLGFALMETRNCLAAEVND